MDLLLINTYSSLISGLFMIGLGVFVFLKNPKQKSNLIFLIFCIAVAWWLLSTFMMHKAKTDSEAIFWDRIVYAGVVFIPILMYHFGLIFTDTEKKNKKKLYFGYFGAFAFLVLSRTDYFVNDLYKFNWGVHTQAKLFHHFFLVFFIVYVFLFLLEIYRFLKKRKKETVDETKIKQVNYLFASFIIMNIGAYAFLSAYGININPIGAYWMEIIAVSILAFAILKYHLFEIRVILTEILVGVMGLILLVLPFLMPTATLRILTVVIFLLFLIFGYYLIKATHEESKRREEAEKLAVREHALREKAEKLARLKTEFLAMASHQLRTPPTSIKGYISMVLEGHYGKAPAKIKEVLRKVFTSNERLIRITNQFLTASNLELGRLKPEFKELFLEKEVLELLIEEFKPKIKAKNLYLKLGKAESPAKVFVDPDQIKEVFSNLLDNAIKYTSQGGIEILLENQENSILVSVKDTGEGLSAEEEKRIIFESFGKGRAGYLHWMEGAGLGLYITKKLVELNKGKIWAKSEGKDKGSTFYIELPIKE